MLGEYCCQFLLSGPCLCRVWWVMCPQVCTADRPASAREWHVRLASVCQSFQLIRWRAKSLSDTSETWHSYRFVLCYQSSDNVSISHLGVSTFDHTNTFILHWLSKTSYNWNIINIGHFNSRAFARRALTEFNYRPIDRLYQNRVYLDRVYLHPRRIYQLLVTEFRNVRQINPSSSDTMYAYIGYVHKLYDPTIRGKKLHQDINESSFCWYIRCVNRLCFITLFIFRLVKQ